jgi:hypothetical protein
VHQHEHIGIGLGENSAMITPAPISLSHRDRAVLQAVAAGRCEFSADTRGSLTIDGICCCDQFVGPRLASAGLIAVAGSRSGPARLTESGQALIGAA